MCRLPKCTKGAEAKIDAIARNADSEAAQKVCCHDTVVVPFAEGTYSETHSIEFIPVGWNGYGTPNTYLNINVYPRYPKDHRLKGQRNPMDTRVSLPLPELDKLIADLTSARDAMVKSLPATPSPCCCCCKG